MLSKNVLIVGSGTKFGANMSAQLKSQGYTVYGVTGSTGDTVDNFLKIDWNNCDIQDFEKFLRGLPVLELIIFNQNSPGLTNNCTEYNSTHIFEIWKDIKQWKQSHYVNCGLPIHFLHTLNDTKKITSVTKIIWMLSAAIFNLDAPVDYIGQKYQNYTTMKKFAKNTKQIHIGVTIKKLTDTNQKNISAALVNFLINELNKDHTGKFFATNDNDVTELSTNMKMLEILLESNI